MGTQPLPKKGAEPPPQFSAHVYCGQTAEWIKMALGMEVGHGPGHIVLDGEPAPFPRKGGRSPQFSAHFYCRQTARCIKMPLGMEVGLSPGDFVLDGDPASPALKGHSPQFLSNVRCGQTTGWMKTPLGTEVDLARPRPHCIRHARKGHSSPPSFRPMSIVTTVAHLSYC